MNQSRLINKLLAVTLIISPTLGCKRLTGLGGTPDPNQAIINAAILNSQPGDKQALNRIEHETIELLREQSGARAALGDQADAIFLQMDQAKAAAVEDLMKQAGGESAYAPKLTQMIAFTGLLNTMEVSVLSKNDYPAETLGGAMFLLSTSPYLFKDVKRDENGNAKFPKEEMSKTEGNTTHSATFQPTLVGSRMEAKVVLTSSMTKPIAYTESTTGTVSMDVCPDAQGNVPLQFSFQSSAAMNGGGQQIGLESQVTGHVNDEGDLASYDSQTTASGARQVTQGAGATTNQYLEFKFNVHQPVTTSDAPTTNGEYSRQSSETNGKAADEIAASLTSLQSAMTLLTFTFAQWQWTSGYCLELQVPGLGAGGMRVQPNSETPFTAKVRHKFENVELPLPVIATLSAGQVSVNPSGSKVPAPAKFIYKAPDKNGQKATVNLETRSKRGVAKLDVNFTTGGGYKVDGPFGKMHILGEICSLDVPFTLNYDSAVGLFGTIKFSPSSENGGTWSLEGALRSGGVTNGGAGSYTIESSTEKNPTALVLKGTGTQTTVHYGTISYPVSETIQLYPSECSQP